MKTTRAAILSILFVHAEWGKRGGLFENSQSLKIPVVIGQKEGNFGIFGK